MKRPALLLAMMTLSLLLVQVTFAQTTANWTILHYTAVDNNLEGAGLNDYFEMQSIGSGSGVNIVAQLDRAVGHDARFGDWTGTRRYYIEYVEPRPIPDTAEMRAAVLDYFVETQGADPEVIRAEIEAAPDALINNIFMNSIYTIFTQDPVEDLGEVDMSDPQSLLDFIVWGVQNYPANHYMIVIGSHGAGWAGIGPDEGNGESMLDLPEINAALSEARSILGIDKFDIVGFDACLMAVTDVAVMLEPHADYVLFSQEVIPANGWEYRDTIAAMQQNPDWDAFQVGANVIDNYMDYYAGPGARTKVGLSLVETAQLPNLLASLNNFAQVVGADTAGLLSALGTARNNSQTFGASLGDRADQYSFVDLRDFMTWFSLQTSITEDAFFAAQEVIAAYDASVVYSRADDQLPRATGLAVYLPSTPNVYATYGATYPAQAPADLAFWQDYLNQFYATIVEQLDGSALQLEIDSVFTVTGTGSILDNPIVNFDAAGLGVIDLAYTITYLLEDGTRIVVDTSPISYNATLPTGEVVIEYPNELTPSTFTWGAEVPFMSDGVNSVLALLQSTSSSGNEAYISGTYVTAEGSHAATLIFDNVELTYSGMMLMTEQSAAVVNPRPGDQFIVDIYAISPEGEVTVNPATDSPLTFGVEPFTIIREPGAPGTYEIGLSMKDLAGNSIYRSTTVGIDSSQANPNLRGYTDSYSGIYFQYPRFWGDMQTLVNEDDSTTSVVSELSGNYSIYVDVFTDIDLEGALGAFISASPSDYGDIAEITFAGMPALAVDFASSSDDGPVNSSLIAVQNESTGEVIVLTIQAIGEDIETLNALIELLNQSLFLFEPPAV